MVDDHATLLARLADVAGAAHVLRDDADVEPYLVDHRGRYRGRALGVVRPGNTQEVAAIVRACGEHGVAVVAQGGNTGLCGGATPDTSGREIVLSLARMNRVRAVDVENATLTVEAGVPLAQVQAAAGAHGMLFPLSLASEGSCTIGGNLSTNAGGTAVLRFGNARELTLGLEVVLADGRIWNGLRGLRKDNTGYDLKQLFIGAEGTLGIVTAAVLKLFAMPHTRVTAFAALDDVAGAIALLRLAKGMLGDRLVGFELVSDAALALSQRHHPGSADPLPGYRWYALLQADDSAADAPLAALMESTLEQAAGQSIVRDATIAQSQDQAARLWALRENVSEAQRREGPNIKHDIALPVSAIPRFLDDAHHALARALPGVRFVIFGHLGDGNLHYNLAAPQGQDAERFMRNTAAANRIVHDLVAAAGGSISAEHGIGQLKREELLRYKSAVEIELMHRVKAALDPRGMLNPGKLL
ncbi:MAG TPA: FAD-binding oxidoreductase [Casimicrobiaceae bacterium]